MDEYQCAKKTGKEIFYNGAENMTENLLSFWQWSNSDILGNVARGVLAEYIVALAAGCETTKPRVEWGDYDLETPDGIKIEVKSSAYLQSWKQEELSNISFRIKRTVSDTITTEDGKKRKRRADIYVFCVLKHQEIQTIDPLNLAQWNFYVLATKALNEKTLTQQTIALSSLKSKFKLELAECEFHQLKVAIQKIGKQKN